VSRHQLDDREMAFGREVRLVRYVEGGNRQLVTAIRAGCLGMSPLTGRRVERDDGNIASARRQPAAQPLENAIYAMQSPASPASNNRSPADSGLPVTELT
jgi:hypothetical protein